MYGKILAGIILMLLIWGLSNRLFYIIIGVIFSFFIIRWILNWYWDKQEGRR